MIAIPSEASSGEPSGDNARASHSSALAACSGPTRSAMIAPISEDTTVTDGAERVDRDQPLEPVLVRDSEVKSQVPSPRMAEQVARIDPSAVHHGDGVGDGGLDVEGAFRRRGGHASLLIPGNGVAVLQFSGQALGVVRQAGASVQKQYVRPFALLPDSDRSPGTMTANSRLMARTYQLPLLPRHVESGASSVSVTRVHVAASDRRRVCAGACAGWLWNREQWEKPADDVDDELRPPT
jgi:hypothetical protein